MIGGEKLIASEENKNKERIRLIIADDHPIVREALKSLICDKNLTVVAEAENGRELLQLIDEIECDLVMLDMSMPGEPVAADLVKLISAKGDKSPPVLIFSMSTNTRAASAVLQAGASGYITKDSEPAQILEGIYKVASGGKYISPTIAEQILFQQAKDNQEEPLHKSLSRREYQVFLMLLDNKSIDNIAAELCVSRQTVGTHKTRLMQKLRLESNMDIVRYALRHGLMSL